MATSHTGGRAESRLAGISMVLIALLVSLVGVATPARAFTLNPATVFINEIHYDNSGTDTGEAIEVAGPAGTDLTGWSIVLYNGVTPSAAVTYDTDPLPTPIPNLGGGFGVVVVNYPSNGIQNGGNDAIALVNNAGVVVQFLSYEGVTTASNGPAAGLTSTDIGVSQSGTEPVGSSIQLQGTGTIYQNFTWVETEGSNTFGAINAGQTFVGTPGDTAPSVTSTTPANGTIDVAVNTNVTVTFSEAVTAASGAFALSCNSAPVALAVSGGPTSFTLDPTADLPSGASCTLTVEADLVTDQDTADPPDNMAADFTSSFTTVAAVSPCVQPFTPIYAIQGSGASAAITGNVTTQGVVVGDFEGANEVGIGGFYLQDLTGDGNAATSDGIFVFTGTAPGVNTVSVGDVVRVTGFARERFNETTLNGSDSNTAAVPAANIVSCGTGSVAATPVSLPVPNSTFLEQYEGMLITLPQNLVISEYFNYDRFGEYVLALPLPGESRPFTPTAIEEPGSPAYNTRLDLNLRSRILIDDGLGSQNPAGGNTHPNGLPFSLSNSFRGGDQVTGFTGVLGFGFNNYRVQPTTYGTYTSVNPRPLTPENVGGSLKVAAFNTLNYFLTLDPLDDAGSNDNPADNICGPVSNRQDCRGADLSQPDELTRQRAKLLATLAGTNADVLGLIELENTPGVEPMADIVAGLPGYAFIETGVIGSDTIKVGIIYRTATVQPVGTVAVLDAQAFVNPFNASIDRNRPAVAQTFVETATGGRFTVIVNHLKSKGSGCGAGDDDTTTGQGNCNGTRAAAAQALLNWIATDPTGSNDPDFMIIGDLNSYAQEDPIEVLEAGGYTNLAAVFQGPFNYSFAFDGQFGSLDYIMTSPSLTAQTTGLTDWHINADEPDLIDYDTSFKSAVQDGYFAPDAFRSGDHDPIIAGLNLDGAAPTTTASIAGTTNPLCPSDCFQGSATVTLTTNEPGVTSYRVNGGTFQTYAGPFTINTEGTSTVEFFSADRAGNTEAAKTTTVKVTTFPATAVLDNFNRSNGRLGSSWLGGALRILYEVRDNQAHVNNGGLLLWLRSSFGADQEAYMRLTAINPRGNHHILVLKSRLVGREDGMLLVSYNAAQQVVNVDAWVARRGFKRVASYPATLNAGDLLGARALADGTVQVYVRCERVGTADTRTVAGDTYVNQGGRIGVWFFNSRGAAFDDFGGGTRP